MPALHDVPNLSASAITTYLACSLKFWFGYIRRQPRELVSANAMLGTAVHAALQWLHRGIKEGAKPPLDEVLRVFEGDWHAASLTDLPIRFTDDEPADRLLVKAKEVLALYYTMAPESVRATELAFSLPLANPETGEVLDVPMKGYIDLIEGDGTLVDFKNSVRAIPTADLGDNLQLTTYAWACETLFGNPPKEIKLVNLVRTKTPKIQEHVTGRSPEDYRRLYHVAAGVLNGVRSGVFLPNRGTWMCQTCEYQAACLKWKACSS